MPKRRRKDELEAVALLRDKDEASAGMRATIMDGIQKMWEKGELCDVTLESQDGKTFRVHRVVLSAASVALAALLGGPFAEGRQDGAVVRLQLPAGALGAVLHYLYTGTVKVEAADIPEALLFAHVYGIQPLVGHLSAECSQRMDVPLALKLLAQCETLGYDELEASCELHLAEHFQEASEHPSFSRLSACLVSRLLRHSNLEVETEEAVLKAILLWHEAQPETCEHTGLLFQNVRFPLMALSSLREAEQLAQSMGSNGLSLQHEVRVGMRRHRNGSLEADDCRRPRRMWWWPHWGSSIHGGAVVAGGQAALEGQLWQPSSLAVHADGTVFVGESSGRVTKWAPGEVEGSEVTDAGSTPAICLASDGLLVANVAENKIHFVKSGTSGPGLGSIFADQNLNLKGPKGMHWHPPGVLFVLDDTGRRVLQIVNGVATLVCTLSFRAARFFVADPAGGTVYFTDRRNSRVVRWQRRSDLSSDGQCFCTVAGGNGCGKKSNQLNDPRGLYVTADGAIYIADCGNHRVVKWVEGADYGVIVAGGHGQGPCMYQLDAPCEVICDHTGALYVLEFTNARVTKWGPAAPILTAAGPASATSQREGGLSEQ